MGNERWKKNEEQGEKENEVRRAESGGNAPFVWCVFSWLLGCRQRVFIDYQLIAWLYKCPMMLKMGHNGK